MNEHEFEPIRGLPAKLPKGERILWQGSPAWRSFALRAFHVRKIAVYGVVLILWRVVAGLPEDMTAANAAVSAVWLAPLVLAMIALPAALAWLYARTTVYTITTRRVVIRAGVALPMTLNLPFKVIGAAASRVHADGTADLPLTLLGRDRIAYLHLWPNARPWHLSRPEPMLRSVPDGARVARILAEALERAAQPAEPAVAACEPVPAASARQRLRVAAAA